MWRAESRKMRDRKFVPFEPEKHLVRAYAVAASHATCWDLFPPVRGYRTYNSRTKRKSYNVSPKRQHSDWSKAVLERDGRICRSCGSVDGLEAHHVWPQSWFPNLRYLLLNGITLCRSCHNSAYHAREVTPGQLLALASESELINANLEAENFWEYYAGALERARVVAYGLITAQEVNLGSDHWQYFVSWAKNNIFLARTEESAATAPFTDTQFYLTPEFLEAVTNAA